MKKRKLLATLTSAALLTAAFSAMPACVSAAETYTAATGLNTSLDKYLVMGEGANVPNVTFGYQGGDPVLEHISFHTKPGDLIALTGASRLGKTTIWTGAIEPRIKVVMPACSGEGGAAISRREYGETVAHLTEKTRFPYQFCPKYAYWADKVHEMPVDAHMLVALIAPRPLLLQTGSTDNWSDPMGEWLALVEGRKVYQLFGKAAQSASAT